MAAAAAPAADRADRILIEKQAHRLTLLHGDRILHTYRVALGTGGLEPKRRQGDNRVPEGVYHVDFRNEHSAFHRALHLSYPNREDAARARAGGYRPGGDVEIHGLAAAYAAVGKLHLLHDWTAGCIAVTNDEIDEIWGLVSAGCAVEIRP